MKISTRARALTTLVVAVLTLAIAAPAGAATRLNDVQYGAACSTRDFYTSVSADAQPDGQPKIDLLGLKFGVKLNLVCGGLTQVCVESRVTGTSSGLGWAGSTPFGGLPLAFPGYYPSGLTTKTPWFNGVKCYATSSRTFGTSVTVASPGDYVFTGGNVKLKQVKIESRARVLVSGTWHYSPWASQVYVNPLV